MKGDAVIVFYFVYDKRQLGLHILYLKLWKLFFRISCFCFAKTALLGGSACFDNNLYVNSETAGPLLRPRPGV